MLKSVFASYRSAGHISTAFLDDSLLIGNTEMECITNIMNTLTILQQLGFIVDPRKSFSHRKRFSTWESLLTPKQLTVTLTPERVNSLKAGCVQLLRKNRMAVREVAKVIGKIVASFVTVKYEPLYYRHLEKDKTRALIKIERK